MKRGSRIKACSPSYLKNALSLAGVNLDTRHHLPIFHIECYGGVMVTDIQPDGTETAPIYVADLASTQTVYSPGNAHV